MLMILDVVEIHDCVAMHTEETIRVEQRLEVFHAPSKQMGRLPHMESNVIPGRLHPSDILDLYNHDPFICFHGKSL